MSRFQDFIKPSLLKAVQKNETHSENTRQSSDNKTQSGIEKRSVSVQAQNMHVKDVFDRLGGNMTESALLKKSQNELSTERPIIQIAEAPIPPSPSSTDLLNSEPFGLIAHDLASNDYASVQKVYYISDLHIEHQLRDIFERKDWNYQELISSLDSKIREMLSEVRYDESIRYLLIGGDVGHSKRIISLFYERLKCFWRSSIIAVLGNHELWDDHPEPSNNSYQSRTIEEITAEYRMIINDDGCSKSNTRWGYGSFLLQNALFVNYKNRKKGVIEERQLLAASDEELRELCLSSSFILLGGVGFSGLNKRFNASNGSYRSAVTSREEDVKLSKRFEDLYDKLNRCASDMQVIVLTHTPVTDWLSKPVNPNWIYINGHTHHNSRVRKNGECAILSDNQVGYIPTKWKLNLLSIRGLYDPFLTIGNGYHSITAEQYGDFHEGREIDCTGYEKFSIIMLKQKDLYMFVTQTKKGLCILQGGKSKYLQIRDIQYYLDNMEKYVHKIREAISYYQSVQKKVAREVSIFGGQGRIHGCIVDISECSHIYVNPEDGTITPYYAPNSQEQHVFKDILSLLKMHERSLCNKYIESYKNGTISFLTNYYITGEEKRSPETLITYPIVRKGQDIYKASHAMRLLQYMEKNIIRVWSDDILNRTDYPLLEMLSQ